MWSFFQLRNPSHQGIREGDTAALVQRVQTVHNDVHLLVQQWLAFHLLHRVADEPPRGPAMELEEVSKGGGAS